MLNTFGSVLFWYMSLLPAQDKALPCDSTVFVPNSISPSSEKCFSITFRNQKPEQFSLIVYNRWGNKIMQSHSWQDCWDQTYIQRKKKIPVEAGVYVWVLNYTYADGKKYSCKGTLSIIR